MKTYTKEELKEILAKHHLWLEDEDSGERADLRSANLRYSDLRSADLRYSDLRYACSGNNKEVKTLQLGKYYTCIWRDQISVGCQTHSSNEWAAFTDRDILEMDGKDGLAWWKQWKEFIFAVAAEIPEFETKED